MTRLELIEQIAGFANTDRHTEFYHNEEGKVAYKPADGPITPAMIARHVKRGDDQKPLGMYLNIGDERTHSHCVVFDFDDHSGGTDDLAKGATSKVAKFLNTCALPYLVFRSGGGNGYHIWMFFEEPLPVDTLQDFAKNVLLGALVRFVEIFPKNTGWSNIAIPCSRKSVPVRLVEEGGCIDLEDCKLKDLVLAFVPPPKPGQNDEQADVDKDAACDAFFLAFNVDDRDSWVGAGIGLQAAFSKDDEWARDRWVTWSRTSGKNKPADDKEWAKLPPHKKLSPFSFWRFAIKHGYEGACPGAVLKAEALQAFNAEWALIDDEGGSVEFLNTDRRKAYNKQGFNERTMHDEKTREQWRRWPARRVFTGLTYAGPDYAGTDFNMFVGHRIEPTDGDASLFVEYVLDLLCDGDKDLAHWVTTFVADGVQEPWSARPGSGLGIRGPAGSGKSFLGKCILAVMGANALEVTDSSRVTKQFNDALKNKTFLLCEEAWFTGDGKVKSDLKNLVTSNYRSFEAKFKNTLELPNIFRVIATTNDTHAIALDTDDRRWTIIKSLYKCPFGATTREAIDWWQPYYDLVEKNPGVILRYLLDYEVDKKLLLFPHETAAKGEDLAASNKLLQLAIQMCETGTCFDDVSGRGAVPVFSLLREVQLLGGYHKVASRTVGDEFKKMFGCTKTDRPMRIVDREGAMYDRDGVLRDNYGLKGGYPGIQMPPLPVFRTIVSAIAKEELSGPDEWQKFETRRTFDAGEVPADPDNVEDGFKVQELKAELERVKADLIVANKVIDNETPF